MEQEHGFTCKSQINYFFLNLILKCKTGYTRTLLQNCLNRKLPGNYVPPHCSPQKDAAPAPRARQPPNPTPPGRPAELRGSASLLGLLLSRSPPGPDSLCSGVSQAPRPRAGVLDTPAWPSGSLCCSHNSTALPSRSPSVTTTPFSHLHPGPRGSCTTEALKQRVPE